MISLAFRGCSLTCRCRWYENPYLHYTVNPGMGITCTTCDHLQGKSKHEIEWTASPVRPPTLDYPDLHYLPTYACVQMLGHVG